MIDFYTSNTANGQKVAIMLEECGLPYKVHIVDMAAREHLSESFLKVNPGGKIPAIIDHDGPGGEKLALAQSLAIVLYLSEKTGRFMPTDLKERAEAYQYLSIVASDVGGAFTGMFMFGIAMPNTAPLEFYRAQAERQMRLLELRLSQSPYLAGDSYSIADILTYPVVASSSKMLPDGMTPYPHFRRWAEEIAKRPAVARGMAAAA